MTSEPPYTSIARLFPPDETFSPVTTVAGEAVVYDCSEAWDRLVGTFRRLLPYDKWVPNSMRERRSELYREAVEAQQAFSECVEARMCQEETAELRSCMTKALDEYYGKKQNPAIAREFGIRTRMRELLEHQKCSMEQQRLTICTNRDSFRTIMRYALCTAVKKAMASEQAVQKGEEK